MEVSNVIDAVVENFYSDRPRLIGFQESFCVIEAKFETLCARTCPGASSKNTEAGRLLSLNGQYLGQAAELTRGTESAMNQNVDWSTRVQMQLAIRVVGAGT